MPRKPKPTAPGRPDLLTPEVAQSIARNIALGATRADAARAASVGVSTLMSWLQQARDWHDKPENERPTPDAALQARLDLLEAVEKADGTLLTAMAGVIVRAARNGSWQAATWMLERRRPDEYGRRDRTALEVTGKDGGPIDLDVETPDWKQALAERLERLLPPEPSTEQPDTPTEQEEP